MTYGIQCSYTSTMMKYSNINSYFAGGTLTRSTYGETPPSTISSLLRLLSNHHDGGRTKFPGDFVDAGSGRGGVLCVAALEGMFDQCRGIEYDQEHSRAAFALESQYNKYRHQQEQFVGKYAANEDSNNSNASSNAMVPSSSVQYICGDLADEDFEGASVVYSNAVVFDSKLCSTLGRILDEAKLQPNAFVVTATTQFCLPSFELVDMLQLPCNGGQLFTFYVNQKRSPECASNSGRGAVPAVSDSDLMRLLRNTHVISKKEGSPSSSSIMDRLVATSLLDGGLEGLSFLAALSASETNVRVLCENYDVLNLLVTRLHLKHGGDLATRASTSILLRAMSAFHIGRRTIAQDDRLLDTMFSSLAVLDQRNTNNDTQVAKNDHVLIRANIVDSLGEVLKDHVGNDVLGNRGIDSVATNLLDNSPESEVLVEACQAVISFRRWRSGLPNRLWSATLEKDVLI